MRKVTLQVKNPDEQSNWLNEILDKCCMAN